MDFNSLSLQQPVQPGATNKLWFNDEGSNYGVWKEQMLGYIRSQGLLGFIDGTNRPPPVTDKEYDLWRRSDMLLRGWILGSLQDDIVCSVSPLETSQDIWLELEKKSLSLNSALQMKPFLHNSAQGAVPSSYLPLYKAAQNGDWETAKSLFFDKDKDVVTAIISDTSETALHVAATSRKSNGFVEKLVKIMPPETLSLKDMRGDTALHNAAVVGNTEAATALVNKREDLLYILNNSNRLPVQLAAQYERKETLVYLMSVWKLNVERSPFEGQLGVRLLTALISSGLHDDALDLVMKNRGLARLRNDAYNSFAIVNLAQRPSDFASGESFNWLQNLIYQRIPVSKPKQQVSQAENVAGDIENTSSDAPAYNNGSNSLRGRKDHNSIPQYIRLVANKFESMIWKVVQWLVPQVKDIKKKKETHQQALELAKYLCNEIKSFPTDVALPMLRNSIIEASKNGISEMVEIIIEMYPPVASCKDDATRQVIFTAVANRYEKVYNIFHNMVIDRSYTIYCSQDYEMNNLMHICAKLAPPKRLNLVTGAALQMQRELQWFKEVEKLVQTSRRTWPNSYGLTPQVIFTVEHKKLKEEGERWMKDTANACTISAALIATIMFAAAFTVPGGVASETGIPILIHNFELILFAISDAVSLFTSITSLLMFLFILTSRYAEEDFLYVLPMRLSIGLLSLFISIIFMLSAFSAAQYLILRERITWFAIPVAALALLPVTSFMGLQFPLLIDVIYSTYGPGIFGKKIGRVMY